MDDSICVPVAHVGGVVASMIRPDRHPATADNLQPLWWFLGSMALIAFGMFLMSWLFPPDLGIGSPAIQYETDRLIVTSRIVNRTIHPVVLSLRFKLVAATAGVRGQMRVRPFAVKDVAITVPGTADAMAKCEFPRTASLPDAPAAEIQVLLK